MHSDTSPYEVSECSLTEVFRVSVQQYLYVIVACDAIQYLVLLNKTANEEKGIWMVSFACQVK